MLNKRYNVIPILWDAFWRILFFFHIPVFYLNLPRLKRPPRRRARPHSSPDPSCGRAKIPTQKSVSVLPNPKPQKNSLAKPSPHFAPPHCPNTWRAEPRKKNTLSFFKRNFT